MGGMSDKDLFDAAIGGSPMMMDLNARMGILRKALQIMTDKLKEVDDRVKALEAAMFPADAQYRADIECLSGESGISLVAPEGQEHG